MRPPTMHSCNLVNDANRKKPGKHRVFIQVMSLRCLMHQNGTFYPGELIEPPLPIWSRLANRRVFSELSGELCSKRSSAIGWNT